MPVLSTFGAIAARGFGWIGALAAGNTGLFAWGDGASGQLGLGDASGRSSPVQVGALTTWSKIIGGLTCGFGIDSSKNLWSWGQNSGGQLGLGTQTASYNSPVQIASGTSWWTVSHNITGNFESAIRSI